MAVAALVACGPATAPLEPGETARAAPVAVEAVAHGERGAIGYRAAFLGSRLLLSVELDLRFALVIRRVDPGALIDVGRIDLGPPEWDVTSLAAPAAGPRVWIGSMDGTVREIHVGRREVVRTWRVGQAVTAAAASPDGRYLVYGTDRGVVCLRRTRDGALLQCMRAHRERVSALAIGDELLSASWGGELIALTLPALRRKGRAQIAGAINDLAARGERVALAISSAPPTGDRRRSDLAGQVAVVDLAGRRRTRCLGHRGPVTAVTWTPGGGLVSGSWDRTLRGWRLEGRGCRERWRRAPEGHHVSSLATDARGRHVAASLWITALDQPGSVLMRYLYLRAR